MQIFASCVALEGARKHTSNQQVVFKITCFKFKYLKRSMYNYSSTMQIFLDIKDG